MQKHVDVRGVDRVVTRVKGTVEVQRSKVIREGNEH